MGNPIKSFHAIPNGVKASIAFFLSSLVSKGIAYITTPIYTRLLTTEEYGSVSVFLTWQQIFGIIAMFCLSYGVFNNGMVSYAKKRDEYCFSMLILSNIITLAFLGMILTIYPLISSIIDLDYPLLLLMFAVFLTQPAYNFWTARQRFEYKYKAVFMFSIFSAIISPLAAVLCMLCADKGERLYPRIFGAEISLIIIYIAFYIYIGSKNKWKIYTKYWKEAFLFNVPLIPHYLSTYLLGSADRVMISSIVGNSETAYYSVAYSVAAVVTIIWQAANGSLIPYTYEKCKNKDYDSINNVTLPILILFAVCCLGIMLFAPEVISIMATAEYRAAIYVIPPIVGGVFFQVQYYVYANIIYYYKKPKYVMFGSGIAVLCNIVLNYIFINLFGYIAAGYTTLACYMIQAIIDYYAMKKVVGESVYNMKYILLLSSIMLFISLWASLMYNYNIVRYSINALLLLLMFVYRRKVLSCFTVLKK